MKYKVGDKVKIKKGLLAGNIYTISYMDSCGYIELSGLPYDFFDYELEPVTPTLADIKEKELTCCINVRSIAEAQFLDDFFECKSYLRKYCENAYKERMRLGYYRTLEDGVAFQLTDGVINDNCSANFYKSCGGRYGEVYEFSDLFPVGSTMVFGDRMYQRTESGITNYKLVPEYADGGVVSIHDIPTSEWYNPMRLTFKNGSSIEALPNTSDIIQNTSDFCTGFRGGNTPKPVKIEVIKDRTKTVKDWIDSLSDAWAKLGCTSFIMSPDEIKKMEEKKMPTKFTFYVTEGTRVDKSCNGTIPTMTTIVEANSYSRTAPVGIATCDKADYDMRQGVLEALANMYCGGDFDKVFNKAVKRNELADKKKRTCTYCGKVFDTVEEKQEHEAWHVERKKARRERYLLRKRAKEIAFEEQAQKLAKEIIAEDNKK